MTKKRRKGFKKSDTSTWKLKDFQVGKPYKTLISNITDNGNTQVRACNIIPSHVESIKQSIQDLKTRFGKRYANKVLNTFPFISGERLQDDSDYLNKIDGGHRLEAYKGFDDITEVYVQEVEFEDNFQRRWYMKEINYVPDAETNTKEDAILHCNEQIADIQANPSLVNDYPDLKIFVDFQDKCDSDVEETTKELNKYLIKEYPSKIASAAANHVANATNREISKIKLYNRESALAEVVKNNPFNWTPTTTAWGKESRGYVYIYCGKEGYVTNSLINDCLKAKENYFKEHKKYPQTVVMFSHNVGDKTPTQLNAIRERIPEALSKLNNRSFFKKNFNSLDYAVILPQKLDDKENPLEFKPYLLSRKIDSKGRVVFKKLPSGLASAWTASQASDSWKNNK